MKNETQVGFIVKEKTFYFLFNSLCLLINCFFFVVILIQILFLITQFLHIFFL